MMPPPRDLEPLSFSPSKRTQDDPSFAAFSQGIPAEPSAQHPVAITREGLMDGSLLRAARLSVPPGTPLVPDAVIEADLDAALAAHPPEADVWLFGYGSLMWNPAIAFAESRPGVVHGWHRRFCLWLRMGRGTPDHPGLMLALDRGGCCSGLLFRIPAAAARAELLLAWQRELFTGAYRSCWITAATADGPVRAATFVVNRSHPFYAGRLDDAAVAGRLATARGPLGSGAAYLTETLTALAAAGLRDRALERLQRLVAAREQLPPPSPCGMGRARGRSRTPKHSPSP